MSQQRQAIPGADPKLGFKLAVDAAIVALERAVKTATDNGLALNERQRADIQACAR